MTILKQNTSCERRSKVESIGVLPLLKEFFTQLSPRVNYPWVLKKTLVFNYD